MCCVSGSGLAWGAWPQAAWLAVVWPRWLWAWTVHVLWVKQSLPCFPINPTAAIYAHLLVCHAANQTAVSGRLSPHPQHTPNKSSNVGG